MSVYFLDTSALGKRYVTETGSSWLRSWITPGAGQTIVISRLATVEMISVLVRKQHEGVITLAEVQRLRRSFVAHTRDQYVVVEFEAQVLNRARSLLLTYPLRTLDALQLSSALSAASIGRKKPIFVTADARLLTATAAEGLPTDDPNLHP